MPSRRTREGVEGKVKGRSRSGSEEETHPRTRLFVKDSQPIYFFLHKNIRDAGQRRVLQQDIETYGGKVMPDEEGVDVILVNPRMDKKALKSLRFSSNVSDNAYKRRIYFEEMSFVRHCIRHGKYAHRLPPIKGMGGYIGRRRTEFTADDDDHLCKFLARTLPDKASGGRTGNNVYQALLENAEDNNELQWATRHPWESWRERYRKNTTLFDPIITQIAREEGTLHKQLWREDRRRSRAYRRQIQTAYNLAEEEEEDSDEVGPGGHDDAEGSVDMDQGEFKYEIELDTDGDEIDLSMKKKKRKRSLRKSTTPSRPRKIQRPYEDSSPIQNARSKGKQRVSDEFEQIDSDQPEFGNDNDIFQPDAYDDVVGFAEPGPSFQRSPERTLVENVSRAHQHEEPFPTQATLVNEGPSSRRVSAFNPVSHSTSANRRHSENITRSPAAVIQVWSPTPPFPPPAQPRRSVEARTGSPVTNTPPPLQKPIVKSRPKPRPKNVVSPPLAEAVPSPPRFEAPYRNTRSRSRSVEPSAQPPAKRRKAPEQKEPIPEESEPEVGEEQQENPQTEPVLPITETVEEEIDVENLLTNADESNNSIQAGLVSERAASLETDDAQTHEDLRGAASPLIIPQPAPRRAPSTVKRIRPQDVISAYEAGKKPRFSLPAAPRTSIPIPKYTPEPQSRHNSRPRQSEPSPATFRLPEPRTPAYNALRGRAPSVSSDEPVPVRGTRASAIKKEKEDLEKHSPYRPPEGTRADMILRSR